LYTRKRKRKDNRLIDVSLTISPIKDSHGTIIGASTIARDITEAKEQQRELSALNARLRRSMTETHHRVKSNLQLMAALIEMRTDSQRDVVPLAEVVWLGQSVQALGMIHDVLTKDIMADGESASISIEDVLERLAPILQGTMGERRLLTSLEDVALPGKQTTSGALVANELVRNAVKHGKGDVVLTLRKEANTVTLEVCDDGCGFPIGFDPETGAHTGLDLVENIARCDLAAATLYQNKAEGGARVSVAFAAPLTVQSGQENGHA
jgi:two-component sensor histidine kinase